MSCTLRGGHRVWSGSKDDESHRTFKIVHFVKAGVLDGPERVMNTAGLPRVGAVWNFDNDLDIWAFCQASMKVTPINTKEPNRYWSVEQTFSTKPDSNRCQDDQIEDPLLEPQKVGGSFVRSVREAAYDRNGDAIKSSSHERLRGPQMEFDYSLPAVWIEQNMASLGLATFAGMVNHVNDAALWGLSTRMIKLSNVSWERKRFATCNFYYTRRFEFDVDYETFDREVPDEGSKLLWGHWDATTKAWTLDNIDGAGPDKTDPTHFRVATDFPGNPTKHFLDGNGEPITDMNDLHKIEVEYYKEANFLLLGIPTIF